MRFAPNIGIATGRPEQSCCDGFHLDTGSKVIAIRLPLLLSLLLVLIAAPTLSAHNVGLEQSLIAVAPEANARAIQLAVSAMNCAVNHGLPTSKRLAVIDYSLPSTAARLWVFDLVRRTLLYRERVAHGRNSGEDRTERFSNASGSFASSLGLFRTLDAYTGRNGYSLRMAGLEPGINDNAMARAIVIHGADYVSGDFIRRVGRIGRSLGCPAVRQGIARRLIDSLRGGQFVYSYYPDRSILSASRLLHCSALGKQQIAAAP